MLEMNKEEFLKTEFGSTLKECITAWDHWLAELKEFRFDPSGQKYRKARKAADQCQAQWQIFRMAIKQFYGISYYFNRSNEYFGVSTEDETDWLFKVERTV